MALKLKKKKSYSYLEKGEGTPIVLLHGLMGELSNFSVLTEHFSGLGYKIFAPELPIYNYSLLNTNVSSIAKFIANFLNDVVKEPAILVGNSLGGHLGLVVTHKHPDLVKALCLTGSSGLYERGFGESYPKRGSYEYVQKKAEEVFYDPKVATKEIVDDVYETVNNRNKAIRTLYIARSAIKHNMKDDLKDIHTPVCLIWGKQDGVTPPEVAEEFHEGFPNSSLYWIDKCGHAPMMEHPEKFNEILEGWLKEKQIV